MLFIFFAFFFSCLHGKNLKLCKKPHYPIKAALKALSGSYWISKYKSGALRLMLPCQSSSQEDLGGFIKAGLYGKTKY